MKLQYLREIVLLSEELNFTKAAEKLYITQPALSKHLSIVEELVGAQLFIRTKHQVILTPAGEYLCNEFKQILLSFDNAVNNVSKLSLGKAGTIAISNPYYFTQEFMEPAIPAIQKQFPEMTINLISCQPSRGYEDMLNDKTDFVLLPYHKYPNSQGIRFYRFATEYTTAVMSSKNPLAKKTSILLSDLVNETFIFLRNNYYSEYIKSLLQKSSFIPKAVSESDHIDTLSLTVNQTGGICLMPYHVKNMNRSNLSFIKVENIAPLPMALAYKTDNHNPCIPVFLKAFATVFPPKQ